MEGKSLVPKLRFPDFRNAPGWEQRPLGSEALFFKGRGVSKVDIDPDGSRPCIRYGELYTRYGEVIDTVHSRTSAPESELFLSSKNDVIIPASGETKEDIATASCVMLDGVALGGDINVLRANHNGVFLSYLINGVHRRGIAKVAQGDTVVHLYPSQLAQVPVLLPEAPEQQKIAKCLTSLDELIAAEGRKLEALRVHKKGLMQNLFPREGETTPRLRFPEFRDAGEWEERALDSLTSPAVRRVAKPKDTYVGLGIRSHGKGTFLKPLEAPEKNSMEFLYEVHKDDLIVNITFAWEGAIAIAQPTDGGALVSHRFPTYSFRKSEALPAFFKYSILDSRLIYQLGVLSPGGAGRNRVLNKSAFQKIRMLVPELDEQRHIADCLNSLDDLINNQVKQLDTLKFHKQGLMQGLFPSLGEVVA